jgi:glucokinase
VWVLFVGSGVGSAIIANGQPMRGAFGVAGEFGHVKVVRDGRRCGCGELGCLEAYAGGHNLVAQMKERLSQGAPSLLRDRVQGDFSRLGAGLLEECALLGDAVAKEIYETARHHLGLAVANQVTVLNPSHLILGGGVLENCPHLRKSLAEDISKYASSVSREGLVVTTSGLGDNSGLVGAGLLGAGA